VSSTRRGGVPVVLLVIAPDHEAVLSRTRVSAFGVRVLSSLSGVDDPRAPNLKRSSLRAVSLRRHP
jgi:hypothetical protein